MTELEQLAGDAGARFVEVVLTASKDEMRTWFTARSAAPDGPTHHDAQLLVDRLGGYPALDQMHNQFAQLVESRPATRRIPARAGDVDSTLRELERVLADEVSE